MDLPGRVHQLTQFGACATLGRRIGPTAESGGGPTGVAAVPGASRIAVGL